MTMEPTPRAELIQARRYPRVAGPFEGVRVSTLPIPVLIHNLSVGGCFVEALHDQLPGRRLTLQVEVPFAGRLQLEAETLYSRPDYGFGVKFVDVTPETHERLRLAVERIGTPAKPE